MTRQVWKLDDQGRPTRLCTVETYEAKATWWQAVLAVVMVALIVGMVFGNASEYRRNVGTTPTTQEEINK